MKFIEHMQQIVVFHIHECFLYNFFLREAGRRGDSWNCSNHKFTDNEFLKHLVACRTLNELFKNITVSYFLRE